METDNLLFTTMIIKWVTNIMRNLDTRDREKYKRGKSGNSVKSEKKNKFEK